MNFTVRKKELGGVNRSRTVAGPRLRKMLRECIREVLNEGEVWNEIPQQEWARKKIMNRLGNAIFLVDRARQMLTSSGDSLKHDNDTYSNINIDGVNGSEFYELSRLAGELSSKIQDFKTVVSKGLAYSH